jgi:hypothetical protein
MSLQCYALCLVFYASCTYDFRLQTLPSTMQLKRLLVCDHNVPHSRGGVLSWSLSRSNLNSPVFSLVVRILAFSTTLVTSKLEVINHPLSSIRERPRVQFLVRIVQPSRGSGIPASRSSWSFFAHFGIAALYPPEPSLCLNLFFEFSSFILLLRVSYPGSRKHRTEASIRVPRMFNHTHGNNMINR